MMWPAPQTVEDVLRAVRHDKRAGDAVIREALDALGVDAGDQVPLRMCECDHPDDWI